MPLLQYAAKSALGYKRTTNEDYIMVEDIAEDVCLGIVADGSGSKGTAYQPASICAIEIRNTIKRMYKEYPSALLAYPEAFLENAVASAGRTLAAFKVANEEIYNGYAVSIACCLFTPNGGLSYANTGNTRVQLLRVKNDALTIKQLTKDQTEGQKLVDRGEMTFAEYHLSRERLAITGGLGVSAEPTIQTYRLTLKPNDRILATTDGVHCAIRPDVISEIVARSSGPDEAVRVMMEASEKEEYNDNAAAALFWWAE